MKKKIGIICSGLLITAVAIANDSTVSVNDSATGVAYNKTKVAVNKAAHHDPLEVALLALKAAEQNGHLSQANLNDISSLIEQSLTSILSEAEALNIEGGDWQNMLKVSAILDAYSAFNDLEGIQLLDANKQSQLTYLSSQLIDTVIYQNDDYSTETFLENPSTTNLLARLLIGSQSFSNDLIANLTIENALDALRKHYFSDGYQPYDIWEDVKLAQTEPTAVGYEDWVETDSFNSGLAKSDVSVNTLGTSSLSAPTFTVKKNNNKLTYKFNWNLSNINPLACSFKVYGKSTVNGDSKELGGANGISGTFSLTANFYPYNSVMLSNPLISYANVVCFSSSAGIVSEDFHYTLSKLNLNCSNLQDYSLGLSRQNRTMLAYYFSSSSPFYQSACTSGTAVSWKDITPENSYRDSGATRYYYRTLVKPDLGHKQYQERKVYFERVGMRQGGVGDDGLFGKRRACYASYSIYVQRYDLNGKEVGGVTRAYGPIEIQTGTQRWGRSSPDENCAADHYVITRSKTDAKYWNSAKNVPARYVR